MSGGYIALSVAYLALIVYGVWQPGKVRQWNSFQGVLGAVGLSSSAVVATAWFILWRFRRARRYYLRKAKRHPDELVKPGSIIGTVVGRDQLCDALMNDLQDCRQRRPHVIVGTIGVGKTALLVRLTQRLARRGIIPVVLRLRDVQDRLDFSERAKQEFCDKVRERISSASEAERVWQRLRYTQDRVVVLADGLEDVLKAVDDRDNKIRKAINDARDERLPLVITSRPQKSLEAINAAQTILEPLSEEAALQYVAQGSNRRSNKQRMDWVVEAAEIAESPLYLNIAKDLELRGRLELIVGAGGDERSDPRDQDMWALRYDLLEGWVDALVEGALYPEQPISAKGRFLTVEYLSVLACAALRTNSTYVGYSVLAPSRASENGALGEEKKQQDGETAEELRGLLERRVQISAERFGIGEGAERVMDERLAASWGSSLGLVEERGSGVRFHHSVLQAFLASRCMDALVNPNSAARQGSSASETCEAFFDRALKRPGRELSMSLVFYSRSVEALAGCHCHPETGEHDRVAEHCPINVVRKELRTAAFNALDSGSEPGSEAPPGDRAGGDIEQDPKIRALELYSATLDVDSFHHEPQHREIVEEIRHRWSDVQVYNDRKLDSPKKALIRRIAATGLLLSRRRTLPPSGVREVQSRTAYDLLFDIAGEEPSHGVRFAIAQAIGEGGDEAFRALQGQLSTATARVPTFSPFGAGSGVAAGRVPFPQEGFDELLYAMAQRSGLGEGGRGFDVASRESLAADRPPSAPGTTRTERLLRKGRAELLDNKRRDEEKKELKERNRDQQEQRKRIMRAWLAPMLVHSCSFTPHQNTPYEVLSGWMSGMRHQQVDLELQVALAQGFRQAANHRTSPTRPHRTAEFLNEQAGEMLKRTDYWFARLALLHALTLWTLPDDVAEGQPRRGHGASPARQVRQWLEQTADPKIKHKRHDEHPLVRAAGKMARQALQTRRPDRFLWIDEAGMASQIGSGTSSPREWRMHNLWIPPSRGWSTLDPSAQQLLADVLVLLILTEERGVRPKDALLRLQYAYSGEQNVLPPCLARDRTPLDPRQALVGETPRSLPGSHCVDGCVFEFCPYPPKGPQCRTELNELFCIHQHSMLKRFQFQAWRSLRFRRRARWQRRTSVANLRRFWDEMGARARNHDLKEASAQARGGE
ncbi:NACHT domain-containing protein [Streptomyces africanus]|uniref:NACHT domain-containing protein n=1 Tax=Streptomyces africanus TaxID=231024 RepID=UPI001302C9DB|nr:ATP-binding protein [Streptomyces africanus]